MHLVWFRMALNWIFASIETFASHKYRSKWFIAALLFDWFDCWTSYECQKHHKSCTNRDALIEKKDEGKEREEDETNHQFHETAVITMENCVNTRWHLSIAVFDCLLINFMPSGEMLTCTFFLFYGWRFNTTNEMRNRLKICGLFQSRMFGERISHWILIECIFFIQTFMQNAICIRTYFFGTTWNEFFD